MQATDRVTILFVHHGKGLGGAPLSLLYLIQGLDKTRYKPIVLFLHASEVMDLYRSHGIAVVGPTSTMDFPHTKIWWLRWYHVATLARAIVDTFRTALFIAPQILKDIKPDIVHLNTSSLIAWALAARQAKIPVAWHIREPLAPGYLGLRKKIITWCVKKYASTIIPICNNDARPWAQNKKTHVIYNAVHTERFDSTIASDQFLIKHNLETVRPKILFLGGISHEKGTHVIVKAFRILLEQIPEAQLLIAGDNNLTPASRFGLKQLFPAARFKAQIAREIAQLGDCVKFLGIIHDVPAAMASSSVIVFPATVGHFARPIIEAGFMKKPVIASQLSPLEELVVDKQTGFLLSPDDYQAWSDRLYQLLEDKKLNQKMGLAAYTFCRKHFSLIDHADKVEKIYTTILKKESARDANTT